TEGIQSINLVVDGKVVSVDDHGAAWVTVDTTGSSISATATVTDNAGRTGSMTQTFDVVAPAVPTDLTASFSSPTNQQVVASPAAVVGTVGGPGFASYTLTFTPLSGGPPITIGTGNTPITGNALGTFDPTLLPAGPYQLTLTAFDTGGQSVVAQETVNVSGKAKPGDFQLSVTDLTVPSPGLPITVTRTYDALNAGQNDGDFGYGWSFAEADVHLTVSLPNGPFAGLLSPFVDGTRVTVTRPGAAPERFTFEGIPATGEFGLVEDLEYHPNFIPDPGVNDTLTVSDVALTKLDDGTYVVSSDANQDPYNPADSVFGSGTYTLSEHDGLTRIINAANGALESESDRNGNKLVFTDNAAGKVIAITSFAAGQAVRTVVIDRDPVTGLIVDIEDPLAQTDHDHHHPIDYFYDPVTGALTDVVDRNGARTHYDYYSDHPYLISDVVDPLGNVVAQTQYGADGRLTALSDSLGNSTALGVSSNPDGMSATVTMPGGGTGGTVSYGTDGTISGQSDALGNSTTDLYDTHGFLQDQTQTVDGQVLETSYNFDHTTGNLTSITDPLGKTTSFSYNAFGDPTSVTDPLGNTTLLQYDANGNLMSSTGPDGVTTTATYNASGQVLTETTPQGTTRHTYDAAGDVLTSTNTRGVVTTYTYDADGNELTSSWTWLDPTNANHRVIITTANSYDEDGQVTETRSTSTDQTLSNGQWIDNSTVTNSDSTTDYDLTGRVTRTRDAITGDETDTLYDADGRVIQTK
ncbi:MAG: hypothetical protein P4L86_22575, partial [Mycobacterium sp.]|nr:hypothetical protein [Mycobacterium sp.]